MTDDDQIQDAEVIEEGTVDSNSKQITNKSDQATQALDLTSLINRYVADIEKVKNKLKEQRQMFKDAFENDKEYHDKNEVVKAATKEKNAVKQRIMRLPGVESAAEKTQELQSELKELNQALSGYLQEHIRTTGTRVIETEDGKLREIVPVYKLVNKKD